MAGRERVGDRAQLDGDRVPAARHERRGILVPGVVGEVEQPARDEGRRPVGPDVAQARRDQRTRAVGGDGQRQLGGPEQLEALAERRGVERQRAAVVGPLVVGVVARSAPRAPRPGVDPGRLGAADQERRGGGRLRLAQPPVAEREAPVLHRRRRPSGLGDPAARAHRVARRGRTAPASTPAARLVVDAVRLALEPAVPPAHGLRQEPDRRARVAVVRVGVRPRADQALVEAGMRGEDAEDRAAVRVGPAADHVHGAGDRAGVLAHRAVLPVGVPPLVREPRLDEGRRPAHPLDPRLTPSPPRRPPGPAGARCRRASSTPTGACPTPARSRPCNGRRRRSGRRSRRR